MTVLYIPVVALFANMLYSCRNQDGQVVSCWSGVMLVQTIVVLVITLIFITLSLTFALSVFQQDPTDRSEVHSRPHSRIDVYQLLMKTVLVIFFVSLEHHKELVFKTVYLPVNKLDINGFWSDYVYFPVFQCSSCFPGSYRITDGGLMYCVLSTCRSLHGQAFAC
jgi:hypothetical protein